MLLFIACASEPTLLLAPDTSRTGADGTRGPLGAALLSEAYTARVSESVRVDFVYPADDAAEPEPADEGWPLVVFVHGGAVAPDRYHWIAAHLASRGFAVALPHHPLDLAISEIGNARIAREGVVAARGELLADRAAVGGHSLGGVVSVIDWVAEPAFDAVFLAGSYPDEGTDPKDRGGSPALSLVGSDDGYSKPADVADGAARFAAPIFFGVVGGMNHFDWTDNPTESELKADGEGAGTEASRLNAMNVVDTWLDASLRDDPEAAARLAAGVFFNVETSL